MEEFNMSDFLKNKKETILKNGVYYLSSNHLFNEFETIYLRARDEEQRILDDEQVKKLPFKAPSKRFGKEWKMRADSFMRFNKFCINKNRALKILDVGSGNGWCAAKLADIPGSCVLAVDVNRRELEQAARIFRKRNLFFLYADVFESVFNQKTFDIIILNASVQYFEDLTKLLTQLKYYLKDEGEIHIIDSPFYLEDARSAAHERSEKYYDSINVPGMKRYYFHHAFTDLGPENYKMLYQPHKSFLKKIFRIIDSPFPWIGIKK